MADFTVSLPAKCVAGYQWALDKKNATDEAAHDQAHQSLPEEEKTTFVPATIESMIDSLACQVGMNYSDQELAERAKEPENQDYFKRSLGCTKADQDSIKSIIDAGNPPA